MKRLFAVACLLVTMAGCEKPTPLTGQVFIVTRGGDNFKLGLVPIRLYEAEAFNTAEAEAKASSEALGRASAERVKIAKENKMQVEARLADAVAKHKQLKEEAA